MSTYGEGFRIHIDEAITHLTEASEALSYGDPGVMAIRVAETEALCAGILLSYGKLSREALDTVLRERP